MVILGAVERLVLRIVLLGNDNGLRFAGIDHEVTGQGPIFGELGGVARLLVDGRLAIVYLMQNANFDQRKIDAN